MGSHSRALFTDLLQDVSHLFDRDLLTRMCDGANIEPWPDISPTQFAALALVKSFYKKNVDETDSGADERALNKFRTVNERCGKWALSYSDSWDEVLLGELKRVVYDFFYPQGMPLISGMDHILSGLKCGPGAAIGSPGGDIYSKLFASSLDCTSDGLYRAYRAYTKDYPTWASAEETRLALKGVVTVCGGNRLRFVPKTRDISRIIAIEPTLNMCYQLGIGEILTGRLKAFFGIDISKQPDINRELSRRGSSEGSYNTTDLESASDSLSLSMMKLVIPASQLEYFLLTRSPTMELPGGEREDLKMLSTMGNGYTFPLQTMLFASIITAAAHARDFYLGRPRADSDCAWGVFGDDMIIPMHCHYDEYRKIFVNYGDVLVRDCYRLLRLLGFVVNNSKSFSEGPFRESCGLDAFQGRDVRGVYIKSLKTTQDRFVAINLLNRWSGKTGIKLSRTIRRLRESVPKIMVPLWESDDAGVRVPSRMVRPKLSKKYHGTAMYQKYSPESKSYSISEGSSSNKRWIFNPNGFLLAFLVGGIRAGKVTVRSNELLYRRRFKLAPSWDIPSPGVDQLMASNPEHSSGGPRSTVSKASLDKMLEWQSTGALLNR